MWCAPPAQVIKGQIERQPSDNACLAYWLVNTVTLRHLLQRTIKPMSTAKSMAQALGFGTMGELVPGSPWLVRVACSDVLFHFCNDVDAVC